MAFARADVQHITTGTAHGWVAGEVAWAPVNGFYRGEIFVHANGFKDGEVKFVLNLTTPNAPTFLLLIRGRHCWRLDVNVPHRGIDGTHMQETDEGGRELQVIDARTMFPPIPEDGTVGGEEYAAAFKAFAHHLRVDAGGLDWIDPPTGGRSR